MRDPEDSAADAPSPGQASGLLAAAVISNAISISAWLIDAPHPSALMERVPAATGPQLDDLLGWFQDERQTASSSVDVAVLCKARCLVESAWIGPEELSTLLDECLAPPLGSQEVIAELALEFTSMGISARAAPMRMIYFQKHQKVWSAAQKLAAELQLLMPTIIEDLDDFVDADNKRARRFRSLLKTLNTIDFTQPSWLVSTQRRPWPMDAARLLTIYWGAIDPAAGWGRDQPAVQFLQRLMARIYPDSNISSGAIETEVQRFRKRLARPSFTA